MSQGIPTVHPLMVVTEEFELFFSVALSTIGTIGLFGNVFVLMSFAIIGKLQTRSNLFLVSLSLAEFIICIGVLPFELEWNLRGNFIHSVAVCEFMYTVHFALLSCSAINLMAVSAFRFVTIAYPFPAKAITAKHILITVVSIWMYSLVSGLLPIFGWRDKDTYLANETCYYQATLDYLIFIVIVNYIFPAILIILFYGMIFRIARRHAIKIAKDHICSEDEQRKRKKRTVLFKGAITLAKIIGVFMLCWTPYIVDLIFFYLQIQLPRMMHLTFYLLAYSNIAVNPFLYAGLCEDFRGIFYRCLRLIRGHLPRKKALTVITRRASDSLFHAYKINSTSVGRKYGSASSLNQATVVTATQN